jgi:ubiquinol-cytochrome c reductase cytochrome c subunit
MTRAHRTAVVLGAAALLTAGLAQAQPQSGIVRPTQEPSTPTLQLGAELYAGNCATCHGISGAGVRLPRRGAGAVEGAGPPLRDAGAQAADFYLRTGYMPLSSIHDQPGRNRVLLSDKEIRSVVAYVASLGVGPPVPAADPARGSLSEGLRLFTLHCAGCHQVVAQGGLVTGARVPPLQSANATQIAEAVRIGPYLMPRFPTSQISDAQLNSIIRYVLWTRRPDNAGGWGIGNIGPVPEGVITWFVAAVALVLICVLLGEKLRA